MAEPERGWHGTYRCPVCGYYDGASLEPGQTSAAVACPSCHTALVVSWRGRESVRLSVQVSGEQARR